MDRLALPDRERGLAVDVRRVRRREIAALCLVEVVRRRRHAERIEHQRLHRVVVGRAELELADTRRVRRGSRPQPPSGSSTGTARRTCSSAASCRALPSRRPAVIDSNSSSHSRSCRGMPVHAQMRCLICTWLVVCGVAELEGRQGFHRRRVPGQLLRVDELGEHQRRQRLGVRRDHVLRVGVDSRGLAELAHAEATGEHDLAVLVQSQPRRRVRRVSFIEVSTNVVTARDARRVERVRLLAGERLARVALRQELAESQPDLRARASRRLHPPCRRS